jgi:hypothetical protein
MMLRVQQHSALRRSLLVFAVAATIAFLLLFSIALASSAAVGFQHIALALPVFFFLLLLTVCVDGWIEVESNLVPTRAFSPAPPSRAPPASLF